MATQEDYEFIARLTHEANYNYCLATSSIVPPTRWDDMSDEAKQQLTSFVECAISDKISGYPKTPRQQHELWLSVKRRDGWAYGEVYNLEEKLHPNLVAYEELPAIEKAKDVIFLTLIYSLMATLARERQMRTDECFENLKPTTPFRSETEDEHYNQTNSQIEQSGTESLTDEERARYEPQTVSIQATMAQAWMGPFLSMLKLMEQLGQEGRSRVIGFHADGDGSFHPKFVIPENLTDQIQIPAEWKRGEPANNCAFFFQGTI